MNAPRTAPIRILHIVGGMVRGGIETWLMHILRHRDAERFAMDFIVHTTEPCPYDDELRQLGGRIFPCMTPLRPWVYARSFARIFAEAGPFDIVHSHVHQFNGFTLRCARRAGVPVRIAHSHVDTMPEDARPGLARRMYIQAMRGLIERNATHGLAASRLAANALFPAGWDHDPRFRVLYYGIDMRPFHAAPDPALRAELGLPADAFVLGHTGRFDEQKNHLFLLEIAREVMAREPRARLLLIGAGSLRPAVEQRAAALGIADRVVFAGLRRDVPHVLRSVVDVFAMPSLCEGLALALLEAQTAGVPCVIADTISVEADALPALITRLALTTPPPQWADAILATRGREPMPRSEALARMEASPFNIQHSAADLQSVYAAAVARCAP
jgi:glycosyltransferase involved in cell wall biosynthesis